MYFLDFIKQAQKIIAMSTMERMVVERIRVHPDLWYDLRAQVKHSADRFAVLDAKGEPRVTWGDQIVTEHEGRASVFGVPMVLDQTIEGYIAEVRFPEKVEA